MPDLPHKPEAQCTTNHHQLSEEMIEASRNAANATMIPAILANPAPAYHYIVGLTDETQCPVCPVVRWRITWYFRYHTVPGEGKKVEMHMISVAILAPPAA